MPARDNGFDKDPERARKAGRNNKRGPSIKTVIRKIVESGAPEGWVEKLKNQGINVDNSIIGVIEGRLVAMAIQGDLKAIQELHNRLDGKPHQSIDMTTENDTTIKLEWPEDDEDRS